MSSGSATKKSTSAWSTATTDSACATESGRL